MHRIVLFQLAVTFFVLAVSMVEACVLHWRRPGAFDWAETWLSVGDMVGRRIVAVLPLSLAAPVFDWAWAHRVATIPLHGVWAFLLLFLGLEFCYYWYHRAAHRIRFFWATHCVHHSPNQLSLSTSFRLGWTGKLTGTAIFFAPLVLIGFPPQVVLTAVTLNLLYQFWLHTTWIPKLGWFEYIFNTPSAHRVHHGSNECYLDKNYGGVLVIFDRLFGTYQEERADEPCVYGLVHPVRTRNLFALEFVEWIALWRDLRAAPTIGRAIAHVWRPPGWTPEGEPAPAQVTALPLPAAAGRRTPR